MAGLDFLIQATNTKALFRRFGAGHCSDEAFDDFLHMWRVFGYYLGVEDPYNPVRPNVHETRKLLLDIGDELIIPSVLNLNYESMVLYSNLCVRISVKYFV